jgi:hypothetical protein
MKTEKIIELFNPCSAGEIYLRKYKTLKTAWKHCKRGDWMLWLARKMHVDARMLVLAKGLCANTARHLMKNPRSIAAVDAAIAFGRGEITKKELTDAAAYAADYADADDADDAAVVAAYAVAAYAYDAAYAADARKASRRQAADICREILTEAVMEAAERGER